MCGGGGAAVHGSIHVSGTGIRPPCLRHTPTYLPTSPPTQLPAHRPSCPTAATPSISCALGASLSWPWRMRPLAGERAGGLQHSAQREGADGPHSARTVGPATCVARPALEEPHSTHSAAVLCRAIPFAFLHKISDDFLAKHGARAGTAQAHSMDRSFGPVLKKQMVGCGMRMGTWGSGCVCVWGGRGGGCKLCMWQQGSWLLAAGAAGFRPTRLA